MAGKVKVKKPKATTSEYTVSGTTLAEIWEDIKRKGPKHKGKARAGKTTCPLSSGSVSLEDEVEDDKKSGEKVATARIKKFDLTMTCQIRIPKLASDAGLSDKAKKEWKRFLSELKSHEQEHVDVNHKEADAIAADAEALAGTGRHAEEKKAVKAARADFEKKFKAEFAGDKVDKRLEKVNDALDGGGHGPTLDTSIP